MPLALARCRRLACLDLDRLLIVAHGSSRGYGFAAPVAAGRTGAKRAPVFANARFCGTKAAGGTKLNVGKLKNESI